MELLKNKKFLFICSTFIIVIVILICSFMFIKSNEPNSDATKFKYEYELLNGVIREKDNHVMQDVSISENNPIKYIDYKTVNKIFDNKETAIIYFGFPQCPWCRTLVPVMLEAADKTNIDTLYYLHIKDSSLLEKTDESGNKIEDEEQVLAKQKLIEELYYNLNVYELSDEDLENLTDDQKVIYSPTVLFIKNGEVVAYQNGTVDSQEKYSLLTEEQHKELLDMLIEKINKIK